MTFLTPDEMAAMNCDQEYSNGYNSTTELLNQIKQLIEAAMVGKSDDFKAGIGDSIIDCIDQMVYDMTDNGNDCGVSECADCNCDAVPF